MSQTLLRQFTLRTKLDMTSNPDSLP